MKKRIITYILGMIILALGLVLNTKTTLGVSPIISVAYTTSDILSINFGNMTFLWYAILVLIEICIHIKSRAGKKAIINDLLQLPLSLVFTRFMNIFVYILPVFANDFEGKALGSLPSRFIFLFIAILLTGIGASLTMDAKIVPNPGDGVVQTIAEFTNKNTGLIKNAVDITCVATAIIIGLVVKHKLIGIGVGTILAALLIGRVIFAYHKILEKIKKEKSL
ncbi:MAG: DUF6198 family protein [Parasporobacterium sp.]|nr:DUF6198 family protein [Parasporobacterium sp.]